MIIISPTAKLRKDIDGVTFVFNPPIGETEIAIMQCLEGETMAKAQTLADEEIKKAGKSKISAEKYKEIVSRHIAEITSAARYESLRGMDRALDIALCGWESATEKLPEFPKDGRPSQYMSITVKQRVFEWYQEQFLLGRKEQKN